MFRSGIGYDLHRTEPGGRLVLGGVEIPAAFGLAGHSDADVVLHALCDALLGAAGLGDIGEWFPDNDPQHRGADSRTFLPPVLARLRADGWAIENVDVVVHAERPKLTPHKPALRRSIAELLGIDPSRVSVKATTNEGLDAVGRGEALACLATALLRQRAG